MHTFERLRSLTRRRGILLWMLLAAYVCAPLASAMAPVGRTVVVPFCTTHEPVRAHEAPAPQKIALHFTGTAHAGSTSALALPPTLGGGVAQRMGDARARPLPAAAPTLPRITRLPPPRAPPATSAQS